MQEILDSPDQDKRIQLPDSHPRGEWLYLLPGQQDQQTAAEPIEEDHNPDPADPHPFSPFIVPTRIDKEGASPDTPVDSPTTPDGAEEEKGDLETLEAVPMEGGEQNVASVGGDVGQEQDMEAQAEDGSEGKDIGLQAAAGDENVTGTVEDGSAGKDMGMEGGDGGACKDEGDDKIDKGVASTEHHILDDLARRILTRADQDNLQYPDGKPRGRPRGRKNGSGKKSNGRGRGRGRGARKEKATEKLEEPEHKKPTRAPRKPKEAKKLDFEQAVGDNSWSLVPGEPGQEGGDGQPDGGNKNKKQTAAKSKAANAKASATSAAPAPNNSETASSSRPSAAKPRASAKAKAAASAAHPRTSAKAKAAASAANPRAKAAASAPSSSEPASSSRPSTPHVEAPEDALPKAKKAKIQRPALPQFKTCKIEMYWSRPAAALKMKTGEGATGVSQVGRSLLFLSWNNVMIWCGVSDSLGSKSNEACFCPRPTTLASPQGRGDWQQSRIWSRWWRSLCPVIIVIYVMLLGRFHLQIVQP